MGPLTGFSGSAFRMRSTFVGGCFIQNGPQDRKIDFLAFLACFRAANGAARGGEISISSPDTQKPLNRELRPQEAEPSEAAVGGQLRNANTVPMIQKFPQNSPLALSYGRYGFFLGGWVPNRQKRSRIDEMAPAPPKTTISRAPGTHGTANRVHWVRI